MLLTRTQIEEGSKSGSANVLLLSKYRVRLLPTKEVPIFENLPGFHEKHNESLVIDLPPAKDELALESNISLREDDVSDDNEGCDGPLQFTFLSADKLNQQAGMANLSAMSTDALIARCAFTVRPFETTPLTAREACTLRQLLLDQRAQMIDPYLCKMPLLIVANAKDPLNSVYLGVHPTKNQVTASHCRSLGPTNANVVKTLMIINARCAGMNARSVASAHYNLIDKRAGKLKKVVSGRLNIVFNWSVSPNEFLNDPPPSAQGKFHFAPGWKDDRICLHATSVELERLLNMCHVLSTGRLDMMQWPTRSDASEDANVIAEVNVVIDKCRGVARKTSISEEDTSERRFLDMTEQLWCVLSQCTSNENLIRALRAVFDALRDGAANAIVHNDNRTLLARLIRDACNGELMLPRLEALTPIQILAEVAAEKIRRDITYTFVSEKLVTEESHVLQYINAGVKTSAPVEERAGRLKHVHLALQTMIEVTRYLRMDSFKLAEMSRSVLAHFASVPFEKLDEAAYERTITRIDVQPHILSTVTPFVWTNETWYTNSSREVYTVAHFTRQPRLEYLSTMVEDGGDGLGDEHQKGAAVKKEGNVLVKMEIDSDDAKSPVKKKLRAASTASKTDPRSAYTCTFTTVASSSNAIACHSTTAKKK